MARAGKKTQSESPAPTGRERVLDVAVCEFAQKGLFGARVDAIAEAAMINKQMIYYYFGSKEGLYVAALERVYRDLHAAERRLKLDDLEPVDAITKFIAFTFDYVLAHREFVMMLMNENLQEARYLRQSPALRETRGPLGEIVADILARGVATGAFKARTDPALLYTTIASLCFFYASNLHSMSVFLDTDLSSKRERALHRRHIIAVVLAHLIYAD